MKTRSIAVGMGAACTIFLSAPAPAAESALLEAWVFARYHGAIPIEKLKTAADGALMPLSDTEDSIKGINDWVIIDQPNCILREGSSSRANTEYYLNNISASRPTIYKSDGTFQIGLMGDEPVRCTINNSDKQCDYFFSLQVRGADRYRAVIRALDSIYTNFCRYAR